MGLNFYICCHRCKVKTFLFRGKESEPMHNFFHMHSNCVRINKDAVEVRGDGYGEQDWMSEKEQGGYDEIFSR
jgi:hypothetical protein